MIDVLAAQRVPLLYTATDFWSVCTRSILVKPSGEMCSGPDEISSNCLECHYGERLVSRNVPTGAARRRAMYRKLASRALAERPGEHPNMRAIRVMLGRNDFVRERINSVDAVLAPTRLMARMLTQNGIRPELVRHSPYGLEARLLRRGPRAPAAVVDGAVRLRRDAPPAQGRRDPPRGLQAPSLELRREPSDRRRHERLSPLRPVAVRGRPGGPSDQLHGRRPQRTNGGAAGRDRCPRRPVNLVRELADDHPLGLRRGRSGDRLRRPRSHRDCPAGRQRASVQDGGRRPARGLYAVGRRRRGAAVEAARQRGGPPDGRGQRRGGAGALRCPPRDAPRKWNAGAERRRRRRAGCGGRGAERRRRRGAGCGGRGAKRRQAATSGLRRPSGCPRQAAVERPTRPACGALRFADSAIGCEAGRRERVRRRRPESSGGRRSWSPAGRDPVPRG